MKSSQQHMFFIGRLYLLPACMIASENMASSFQDFLAETSASYSTDDSHLALETIFSCLYFSTCSWRVPAIYVVSISLLLASPGRRSTGQLLKAELAHHSSFCVLHTAKPARALLRSTAAVFITTIDNGKKASQGKSIHSSSSECLQGHPEAGLGKGLMIWTHE